MHVMTKEKRKQLNRLLKRMIALLSVICVLLWGMVIHRFYDAGNTAAKETGPYYEMLSRSERVIYRQTLEAVRSVRTAFLPDVSIDAQSLNKAVLAVYFDHPECIWMESGYDYACSQTDRSVVSVTLNYNPLSEKPYRDAFEKEAQQILRPARKLDSDLEKEKYVHDVLVRDMEYDENALYSQSAYSALVNHAGVCAGYARAFQYLLEQLGITAYYVNGEVDSATHAWNIVVLESGTYNVDLVWDGLDHSYNWFNVDDQTIALTHTRLTASRKLPVCGS